MHGQQNVKYEIALCLNDNLGKGKGQLVPIKAMKTYRIVEV